MFSTTQEEPLKKKGQSVNRANLDFSYCVAQAKESGNGANSLNI